MAHENVKETQIKQFVSFVLEGEEYGIPILSVQEIIRFEAVTRIPQSSDFIEGVLNLRGRVIPVVNLRKKFNFPERPNDNATRIIVVEVRNCVTGMVVDEVSEVLQIPSENIVPPPSVGINVDIQFISGMGKVDEKLIILIDIDRILSEKEQSLVQAVL